MVKEYLKKLRDGLTEDVKRSEELKLTQADEKRKLDETLDTMSANLRHNVELGKITEDDVVRMSEQSTVFLPSKDEAIENINNMPAMAPFDLDENRRIVPAKRRK